MIKEKHTYTNNISDLAVYVIKILHRGDDYIKAKLKVFNKHNGIVYDSCRRYNLFYKNIDNWCGLEQVRVTALDNVI